MIRNVIPDGSDEKRKELCADTKRMVTYDIRFLRDGVR